MPILEKISFLPKAGDVAKAWDQNDPNTRVGWTEVPKALSLFFIRYLAWAKAGNTRGFYFQGRCNGSMAASLGDAITNEEQNIAELFEESIGLGKFSRLRNVFPSGPNMHGKDKDKKDRRIYISPYYLPPDCVEIFWDARGGLPLTEIDDFDLLENRIRESAGITDEPVTPKAEVRPAPPTPTPPEPEPEPEPVKLPTKPQKPATKKPSKSVPTTATELTAGGKSAPSPQQRTAPEIVVPPIIINLFSSLSVTEQPKPSAGEASDAPKAAPTTPAKAEPAPEKLQPNPPSSPPKKPSESAPTTATELGATPKPAPEPTPTNSPKEEPESSPLDWTPPEISLPPIDPKLFSVSPAKETWPDDLDVVTFGEGLDWTLRNAFEGVFILGATGSGKTSGSGATIAESFLHAGFGGLVLTVKTDEAEHWRKLCARCGREKDLVVVQRGGDWRLNLLAYEAQRPGQGGGLAKNLVAFCRNLLGIATRSQGGGSNDQFWQSATDQLLNATFDLFLMAGGAITFDRLANFIAAAPTEKLPTSEAGWLKIPLFGEVLAKAKANAGSAEDLRVLKRTTDYWCKIYPGLASKTRTSITLGVFAMLDTFRGRDVPDLISSDTNLTPESIMSGKIVVLDLPIKEFGQTGLLVQSAWKYLFQMALERQAKAGDASRRPVFLWEDEGQHFFSDHDHHFQATARSARVCRVVLTQNLHNFYMQFGQGGDAAANSVFGNLNTKIFHSNNDVATNEWSSKQFGSEIRTRMTVSQNPPPQASGFFDSFRQMINPASNTGYSHAEAWEPSVRPEEFCKLRNGGRQNDFEVDAFITWPQLDDGQGRHFILTTFLQNTQP
ncbi:MAG: TraM recognition domain-containing protein [Verrucomicrobiae bacterium]|nr:TraM recognition domain-containing protein [Verrucomicrobiae bacterium]